MSRRISHLSLNRYSFVVFLFFVLNTVDNVALSQPGVQHAAGQLRTDKRGVQQVWVPSGSFHMGTNDSEATAVLQQNPPAYVIGELQSEKPQHPVNLTAGYWIDKYEITNASYQVFISDSGYSRMEFWSPEGNTWLSTQSISTLLTKFKGTIADYPCVNVTWYEAQAYANWRGGRLPSEAEWEFAARGPRSTVYPWGNSFDAQNANVVNTASLKAVGSYPNGASWIGAMDMAGNAMEWVQDWLDVNYYKYSVQDDPKGPETGSIKIEKGGWWGSNPFVARSAYRHFEDPPTYRDGHIGFRIVSPDDQNSVIENKEGLGLDNFMLLQNYPNPFNPTTTICYSLPAPASIRIEIYNLLGQKAKTLVDEDVSTGFHRIILNAGQLSSGTYFCRMVAAGKRNFEVTKKIIVLK